jgi:hypothetical protein
MDTLVLIVADRTDERNIDQDQVKIVDTVVKFTVQPSKVEYGCGAGCQNIVVTVEDPDENLNCNEIEYVPVFVIINPGSWNVQSTSQTFPNTFCSLMMYGGLQRQDCAAIYVQPIKASRSAGTTSTSPSGTSTTATLRGGTLIGCPQQRGYLEGCVLCC